MAVDALASCSPDDRWGGVGMPGGVPAAGGLPSFIFFIFFLNFLPSWNTAWNKKPRYRLFYDF